MSVCVPFPKGAMLHCANGTSCRGEQGNSHDARTIKLDDLKLTTERVFGYWFDFGDAWYHQVQVERIEQAILTVISWALGIEWSLAKLKLIEALFPAVISFENRMVQVVKRLIAANFDHAANFLFGVLCGYRTASEEHLEHVRRRRD